MLASSSHQAWLFYSPLAQQAALLKDDWLDPVDLLLDDPALVDVVRQCLAKRSPRSTRTGRRGLAPDRLLRCCVMKHLKGWSFRDLERELRSKLVCTAASPNIRRVSGKRQRWPPGDRGFFPQKTSARQKPWE